MTRSEIKKMLYKRLDPVLKPLGWKVYKSEYHPVYTLDTEKYKVSFQVRVFDSIMFRPIYMAIKEVESYIIECVDEKRSLSEGDEIDDTIHDHIENLSKYCYYTIETKDDVDMVVDYFLDYLFGTAKKFVETYLYLPNIVRKMDELTSRNITWAHGGCEITEMSLSGSFGLFRGLIISKLCNAPLLEEKLQYVESYFKKYEEKRYPHWEDFRSDFEKLKQLLPTIEPKYSMDSPNEEAEMEKIRAMVAKNFTPIPAPTEKPKKKSAKKFVPTPQELVNKELLALLSSAQGEKESLLSRIKSVFGSKAKEEPSPQKQTIEIVGSYLDASLRNHGFCNVQRYKNVFYYTRPTDVGNLIFSFMVGNNGCLRIYPPSIRLDKVEEWMQKIDIKLKSRDGDHQGTIELELPKKIVKLNESECVGDEDVKKLCLATWQFVEERFGDFVEDYSSPQFLWERLCSDIKAYPDWVKIIRGITAPEQIIRGVVFLRLCRDNDFEDKFELVKKFILTEYKSFIPSVNQLKRLLPEMKKEYEVCC